MKRCAGTACLDRYDGAALMSLERLDPFKIKGKVNSMGSFCRSWVYVRRSVLVLVVEFIVPVPVVSVLPVHEVEYIMMLGGTEHAVAVCSHA